MNQILTRESDLGTLFELVSLFFIPSIQLPSPQFIFLKSSSRFVHLNFLTFHCSIDRESIKERVGREPKEDYDYNPYPVQTGHVHHQEIMKQSIRMNQKRRGEICTKKEYIYIHVHHTNHHAYCTAHIKLGLPSTSNSTYLLITISFPSLLGTSFALCILLWKHTNYRTLWITMLLIHGLWICVCVCGSPSLFGSRFSLSLHEVWVWELHGWRIVGRQREREKVKLCESLNEPGIKSSLKSNQLFFASFPMGKNFCLWTFSSFLELFSPPSSLNFLKKGRKYILICMKTYLWIRVVGRETSSSPSWFTVTT